MHLWDAMAVFHFNYLFFFSFLRRRGFPWTLNFWKSLTGGAKTARAMKYRDKTRVHETMGMHESMRNDHIWTKGEDPDQTIGVTLIFINIVIELMLNAGFWSFFFFFFFFFFCYIQASKALISLRIKTDQGLTCPVTDSLDTANYTHMA